MRNNGCRSTAPDEASFRMIGLAGWGKLAVLTSKEDQRLTGKQFGGLNFSQKNRMVARDVGGDYPANDLRKGVFDKRNAGWRPAKTDAKTGFGFGSLFGLGEVDRDSLLMCFQNADAKKTVLFEKREEVAALVHANERQERIERDRREGIGGHAIGRTGGTSDGDDGDAGGEVCAGLSEVGDGKRS